MSVFQNMNLTGKRALVTGSSRGIGKAIASALAEAGAEVVFHGTKESPALTDAVAAAKANGWNASCITGSLGNDDELEALIRSTGDIDILVLNASVQEYLPVEEYNAASFDEQFKVNVGASFRLIQAFLPAMQQKKWGRVVALGSVNQWRQSPRLPIYAATKSALSNLIQNCARKYAADGITFNVIAPGVIATDRNREALADHSTVDKLMTVIPAKRFGTAEDCAGIALLLCSPAGDYITGSDIPVAGGMQL